MAETTQFNFHNEQSCGVELVIEPWALVEKIPANATVTFEVNKDPPPEIEFSLTEAGRPYVYVMSEVVRISIDGVLKHEYSTDVRAPLEAFRILRKLVFEPVEQNNENSMPKYWFRQKSFGYGATPNTWQGWALTIVSCLALFGVVLFGPAIRDNSMRALWMVLGAAIVLLPTCIIAYVKTEGGWRWRNGNDS